jgi:hypothetical protein
MPAGDLFALELRSAEIPTHFGSIFTGPTKTRAVISLSNVRGDCAQTMPVFFASANGGPE